MPTPEAAPSDRDYENALRTELDRRVAELSAAPDTVFGALPPVEIVLAALATIVLPLLFVWWFA